MNHTASIRMDWRVPCVCGQRKGLHEWGRESCPKPRWRTGNGQSQWLQGTFLSQALAQFRRPPEV